MSSGPGGGAVGLQGLRAPGSGLLCPAPELHVNSQRRGEGVGCGPHCEDVLGPVLGRCVWPAWAITLCSVVSLQMWTLTRGLGTVYLGTGWSCALSGRGSPAQSESGWGPATAPASGCPCGCKLGNA